MSVAELHPQPEFERTPPQDVSAEQCALGGMLLSQDAIADVIEILRSGDFYRPTHQTVYDALLDLYGRGDPADPVTVAAELTRRGELERVGGAPYLHTLISSVPTAANAGYYARIVRERAVLRRLVEAGTRIVQLGYAGDGGEVDELVDRAQAEVYAVTERRSGDDYMRLDEIMPAALDEIEAIGSRGGAMVGVPTGFTDLDALTNGLHPGQMVIVAARPSVGKALAVDTPLPTPDGWTTMGQVEVGDRLIAADGTPTAVVAATEVMEARPCYEVTFDDGTRVLTDAEHQWLTDTRASRKSAQAAAAGYNRMRHQRTFASVKTTRQIAETLRCPTIDRRLNHSVANAQAVETPERDLPLPPYVLGAWLGDRHTNCARITPCDPGVVMRLESEGLVLDQIAGVTYSLRLPPPRPESSVEAILRSMGVLGNKHVPVAYLRASAAQRRALLAGLLDTDGTVTNTGAVQFSVTNARLAEDFCELVVSLGYRCGVTTKYVRGRSAASSVAYTVTFTPSDEVFALERMKVAHKERASRSRPQAGSRFITSVRPVPSVPVRCVEVDHPEGLYLATRSMIPTHNSTLGLDLARAASIRNGLTSVIFSMEMSRSEITMRLLAAEARVPLHHMRSGMMSDDDWTRLARYMSEAAEAPLYIDDSPNMSMMEIRAKCRRLKQRHDLRLVVVDYLQLMTSPKRVESRQQEVSELSRSLKLLAKELDVPVIAISQLNRSPEQRQDKKPQLSDLRESGCLTADTRVLRADTGAEVTLGELYENDARDVPVWSLDQDSLRLRPATMTHVFPSGVKEVFELRLRSGAVVKASGNHPFFTLDGWQRLDELTAGTRVAVPRQVPEPAETVSWSDGDVAPLAQGMAHRQVPAAGDARFRGAGSWKDVPGRDSPARVKAVSDDAGPATPEAGGILWDEVASVERLGEQPVYDATVLGTHSFVANGIIAHNSIEQDSDVVVLLYREDAFERESPRAGEADLVVAKHRNGPTATVTVAFQGHYSRFVDMAPG